MAEMKFEYRTLPQGKKTEQRLCCPKCGNVLLWVTYQPLLKPKKGKREVGHFGECPLCTFKGRITAGHRK
jgi:predicted RNA-binding Zn-ribbon protein involved in translation (DUF1610 family)